MSTRDEKSSDPQQNAASQHQDIPGIIKVIVRGGNIQWTNGVPKSHKLLIVDYDNLEADCDGCGENKADDETWKTSDCNGCESTICVNCDLGKANVYDDSTREWHHTDCTKAIKEFLAS